jgi:hypothetical protein
MPKIRIGDRELIYSTTLILNDGETATVEFDIPAADRVLLMSPTVQKFTARIIFRPSSARAQVWSFKLSDIDTDIEFTGWEVVPGPTSISKPSTIFRRNSMEALSFFASSYLCGPKTHNVTVQFYWGAPYDG